jgi:hypothetical protein
MLNGVIGRPSLQCCHHHLLFLVLIISLLSLFHGFPPLSRIEHISKYSSVENCMKLPFQRVVIHRKRSSKRELCPFYFSVVCCPKLISGRVALSDSGITACRNLRLSWLLIFWNRNFMGHLNIQKYLVFSLWDHAEFWWDWWLLAHWSGDVNDLDHSIF